jgi:hypothetical protein
LPRPGTGEQYWYPETKKKIEVLVGKALVFSIIIVEGEPAEPRWPGTEIQYWYSL